MFEIILYIGLCVAGYVVAVPLRSKRDQLGWVGTVQTIAVLALVFTMGLRIGYNEEVIGNLGSYGLYALLYTVAIMVLSVACVSMTRRVMGIDRYGLMENKALSEVEIAAGEPREEEAPPKGIDRMTVYILCMVVAGIAAGFLVCRQIFRNEEAFTEGAAMTIRGLLCVLLTFVGLDLGLEGAIIDNFRKVGVRVLAIPAAGIIGTLLGAFLVGLVLPLSTRESLGIGAGLGWYSLGAAILMDAGMMTAGAISFMHNVMREMFAIILIPVVARKIGYVECVTLPGASAMDVCLPIVVRADSGNTAVYSFISGTVLSFMVPVLVPLFV